MTRKKFIKLVMCHGFSIREARSIVRYAQRSKIPYEKYYLHRLEIDIAVKNLAVVAKLAQEYLKKAAQKAVCAAREQENTKEEEA